VVGAEEDIWIQAGGSNSRMDAIAHGEVSWFVLLSEYDHHTI